MQNSIRSHGHICRACNLTMPRREEPGGEEVHYSWQLRTLGATMVIGSSLN